jgi:large subunit ribosomal protein L19
MRNKFIEAIEKTNLKKAPPQFDIGDTVSVGVRIVEGNKERVQPFEGTVIGRHGVGTNETFTVRRIVNNEGVERIFPLQSPRIVDVEVVRHGKVRRGKLYYLRDRVGKSRKLRERRASAEERAEVAAAKRSAGAPKAAAAPEPATV